MLNMIWDDLQTQIADINSRLDTLTAITERAETCSGVPAYTLAAAPLSASGAKRGDMVFITNGRKTGEGAGTGTGLVAYYNPGTNSYYRFADDTAVVV